MEMRIKIPSKETSDFAEFVGILLGDGSVGIYKCRAGNKIKTQHRVQITLNSVDDKEYVEHVKELIKKLFNIEPITSMRSGKTLDIRMFNKGIVSFLINDVGLVLAPKKNRAKIPEFYIKSIYESDIIRGLFDTDGSVVMTNNNGILYPRLEIKACQSPMQTQIIEMLKRKGFRLGVYRAGPEKIRIQMNGMEQLKKWVNEIGFSNPKHSAKTKKIK